MSAHAMVQEFLNLTDELYGLVTNGRLLRLLRDSSRLVKLTYLEFDLDRIFTDGLFADFAILYPAAARHAPAGHAGSRGREPDRALPPGLPRLRRAHPRRPEPRRRAGHPGLRQRLSVPSGERRAAQRGRLRRLSSPRTTTSTCCG